MVEKMPVCHDSRACFAQRYRQADKRLHCVCLNSTYKEDGKCQFCKPDADITKGVHYPYNPPVLNVESIVFSSNGEDDDE